jgi:hypothetical protein
MQLTSETERAGGVSSVGDSLLVHYAGTYLDGVMTQATACAQSATVASPGVVN